MVANAAFKVIKTTLENGREIGAAGAALGKYFGAEKAIQKQVATGTGNVLEAFQAKEQLRINEENLKFMLNKQRLHGWVDFLAFKAQYTRDLREAEQAKVRQKVARQKALDANLSAAIKAFGIVLVIIAAAFGVAFYVRQTMSNLTDAEKDEIAELAADKAYQRFYAVVGESVVKKAVWILGAAAVAIWVYFSGDIPK